MPNEEVVRTESISKDKDGTLEKVYFRPEARADGTLSEPWEIRATGRKVNELRGAFDDVKHSMLHESEKEWKQNGGDCVITKPDGSTDTVRADWEQNYRQMSGFCVAATKPTFLVAAPWEGSMKRRGLTYSKTVYRDGQAVVIEER